MEQKNLDTVKNEAAALLELLGIEGSVSIQDDDGVAHVSIDTRETGILIGYHGETLYSFQLILGLICYKKSGQWTRLVVNIGDYRQKREEYLKQLAFTKAEAVRNTGRPQIITGLSPIERRVVHLAVAEFSDLSSVSNGEGKSRNLTISLKQ